MNAVVYARYSSHKQGEQSIEGQLAEAKRYALEHGLTIIHEYIDRAQTGRNDNREQFQCMLADASKHMFDALIVWKTDRIGRNKEEIALNKYHLKKNVSCTSSAISWSTVSIKPWPVNTVQPKAKLLLNIVLSRTSG